MAENNIPKNIVEPASVKSAEQAPAPVAASAEVAASVELDAEIIAGRLDNVKRYESEIAAAQAEKKAKQVNPSKGSTKVRLKKEHTNDGALFNKGDEIFVDKAAADFLVEAGVAEIV